MDGYVEGELARAFVTALTHEDGTVRERAERRVDRWRRVREGIASGSLRIGRRDAVAGLPIWVTPEVVRGGFATGVPAAVADGALGDAVRAHRTLLGQPDTPDVLAARLLTEDGLAQTWALLDSGTYRIPFPEQAALLTVAWLVRAGALAEAHELAREVLPHADLVDLTPAPAATPAPEPGTVGRHTVGDVSAALARRSPPPRLVAERRTLAIWNLLADAFLELWLDEGAAGWADRAAELLERYRAAGAEHPPPRRHGAPGANLEVLRVAAVAAVAGALTGAQRSRVAHAVRAMQARRGRPGSAEHTGLRRRQAADAAPPLHVELADVARTRLADHPVDAGLTPDSLAAVTAPAGSVALPPAVHRIVHRALTVPVAEVVAAGVAPSSEVLAELTPGLVAATTARAYRDPALRRLMAATTAAFARRRSLLLTDLSHQVRVGELPWVRAVAGYRTADADDDLLAAARLLGRLALDGFPATILPNPLIDRLRVLTEAAGVLLPWTDELAADIFTGRLTEKFLRAAELAGARLAGTPYARYYGLDPDALARAGEVRTVRRVRTAPGLVALCEHRAGPATGRSVAGNGRVLEQLQILTTHGLVVLEGPLGVVPDQGWERLALRAGDTAVDLVARARTQRRPLRTLKNAAYAWRQMLAHASLGGAPAVAALADWAAERAPEGMLRDGLVRALHGEATPGPERFLGWVDGPHPVLAGQRSS